jgi:hypothetical protein
VELFYIIADPACAQARRVVLDLGLKERVRFRNMYYPEVRHDFHTHAGSTLPALWDGARLYEGLEAVVATLKAQTAR